MQLRPYQREAIDAVNHHLASRDDNGLVVIPTAGGKTIVFATMIREWCEQWPGTRIIILAHVRELLTQARDKLLRVWPEADIGIWSAGLKQKDGTRAITIAGIQSIHSRVHDLTPWDIVVIDEAHLVRTSDDGMYRRFLRDAKMANPQVRVIGFTATPYRMDGGHIASPDYILNTVCYEAKVRDLIDQGYICNLRSKATKGEIDTSGVAIRKGDFVPAELEARANTDVAVAVAVDEMVVRGKDRKTWLVFCCGVAHAHSVSAELMRHGIHAPVITGETSSEERRETLEAFDRGELRAIVNVNVLTTGLDVTRIDMIVLLRPTASTSLYVQMAGRGFRLHEGKTDCLILDYGGNVRRHGPLDNIKVKKKGPGGGEAPVKTCPECMEIVHAAALECPGCGHQFPGRIPGHESKADIVPIISEPWEVLVESVSVVRHTAKNGRPMLLVRYYEQGGLSRHQEPVCLEHDGFARAKAKSWWEKRFGRPVPMTVEEAMTNMFLAQALTDMTEAITVRQNGKYTDVVSVRFRDGANKVAAIAR